MQNKRIFVGLDYMAPFFYLSGLSISFEWLFHFVFHHDEHYQMHQFLKSISKKQVIYRMPFFACVFKNLYFEKYISEPDVYQHSRLFQFNHAVAYVGYHQQMHHYQVAYIPSRCFDEQLSLLGPSRDLLTRIDIDAMSLWFYRSQERPYPQMIRSLEYQQQGIYHRLSGRDECLWIEGDRGLKPDIVDVIEDSPWQISKSLAFGAYYHAL